MVGEKGAKEAVDNLDDSEFSGTHIQVQVRLHVLIHIGIHCYQSYLNVLNECLMWTVSWQSSSDMTCKGYACLSMFLPVQM